jgi:hypothetical protein
MSRLLQYLLLYQLIRRPHALEEDLNLFFFAVKLLELTSSIAVFV